MKIQHSFENEIETLYIVSTPIGNLGDFSNRAKDILDRVDLILCEDTRVTSRLLSHYQIKTKLTSYQKFNEQEKLDETLEFIKEGHSVALVSDAGTPLLNDPGYLLVKAAIQADIKVVAIPGASAVLASLVSSGLLPQPFTFIGFLPRKAGDLKKVIAKYIGREETLVIYESPLRINKTLSDLLDILGNRKCVLSRELTKKFETIYRGDLEQMYQFDFDQRGEYVILLEGDFKEEDEIIDMVSQVNLYMEQGLSEKEALKKVAKILGIHKSEVYKAYKIIKS